MPTVPRMKRLTPIADGVEETMKNGRKAIKGKCPTCGTVMFKILGKAAAAATAPAATPAPAPAPADSVAAPAPNPNPPSQA